MKTKSLLLCLLLLSPIAVAQSPVSDPVKQLHYFAGKWKAETGKDTLLTAVDKAFGNGLTGSIRLKINGKLVKETRQLFGYDPKTGTFVESEISTDAEPELWFCWWTNEKQLTGVPLEFKADPGLAPVRIEIHILSPKRYEQKIFLQNKLVFTKAMVRKS
jgi:hypothetical protein